MIDIANCIKCGGGFPIDEIHNDLNDYICYHCHLSKYGINEPWVPVYDENKIWRVINSMKSSGASSK